jgi:hypothetical protein
MPFGRSIFGSKRDAWIVAMIWGGAILSVIGGAAQLSSDATVAVRISMFTGLVAAAAFMLWVLYTTRYLFIENILLIQCGPFRYRVPLDKIASVQPSRNPLSSPACSLDRLLIKWGSRGRRILISPDDKKEFLRALADRCPQLGPSGEGLAKPDGT